MESLLTFALNLKGLSSQILNVLAVFDSCIKLCFSATSPVGFASFYSVFLGRAPTSKVAYSVGLFVRSLVGYSRL